jgi:hypothetical protein
MEIFIIAWAAIGFMHWLHFMFAYNYRWVILDFLLALPLAILFGPIITFQKILS